MKHFMLVLGVVALAFLPLACKKDQVQSNKEQSSVDQQKPETLPEVVQAPEAREKQVDLPEFAAPVRVMAGGEPMGQNITYPSPAMYDLDGDKSLELLIGDLWGSVRAAKKLPGNDLTAWSELTPLKTPEGEDVKFSNW